MASVDILFLSLQSLFEVVVVGRCAVVRLLFLLLFLSSASLFSVTMIEKSAMMAGVLHQGSSSCPKLIYGRRDTLLGISQSVKLKYNGTRPVHNGAHISLYNKRM